MTHFPPIAIVGQGCVLPTALTPAQLWETIVEQRDALESVPADYWGVKARQVMTDPDRPDLDRTWSDRGGYVHGFDEAFSHDGFQLPAEELVDLDAIFKWSLYAGRQALEDAGHDISRRSTRAGIVLGNKSFPTPAMARFAEQVWRAQNGWETGEAVDPRNRFMSGLPAQLVARALGLGAGAFSLDVACASSLYAIKLACDQLHDESADLMLVGGINRADDLFLHIGFCSLQALSRTGQSRPFHRDADGLISAEGAAFVALKRLEDAVSAGDEIRGVIRGVGLSNDGRSRGLLTPAEDGQVRAMQAAYRLADLEPSDISLAECHATGTPVGDATEVRSMAEVFADNDEPLPIGSLKSNLGHLITASGVAGLLKVLAAMDEGLRPATLHTDELIDALDGAPLRVLREPEPWDCDGPRRAAVNNFGFGGNNAHLIVEQWQPGQTASSPQSPQSAQRTSKADLAGLTAERTREENAPSVSSVNSVVNSSSTTTHKEAIAVIDMSVIAADGTDVEDFSRALFYGESQVGAAGARAESIELDVTEARFPPVDLQKTLPQQLMILKAALQLKDTVEGLPRERTGVWLGMGCDAEIARHHARWRMEKELVEQYGPEAADGITGPLEAAGVLGTMPNLVANRINSQFDLKAASFSISGEEISGTIALREAARALRQGELDSALVGAVELACEPVHRAAAADVLPPHRQTPGDAAVMLVLKRESDARRDGDTIRAILPADSATSAKEASLRFGDDDGAQSLTSLFGHPHAASGLLHVAAAVDACYRKIRPAADGREAMPWMHHRGRRLARVSVDAFTDERTETSVQALPGAPAEPFVEEAPPRVHVYSAGDVAGLIDELGRDAQSDDGTTRLTIVARTEDELDARRKQAVEGLRAGVEPTYFQKLGAGIYLGDGSLDGELSFVFTGPAGAYTGMARSLLLAMPELADTFGERCLLAESAAGWVYGEELGREPNPAEKLWGASFMCQIHAELSRNVLGLEPQAAIGFCAGETNALFAMGAWRDFDGLYEDLDREGIFERRLGGEFEAVRAAWELDDDEPVEWQTWRMLAPEEAVREAVEAEPRAYVTLVNAPGDMVVGGEASAIERIADKVGKNRARPLGYNIAMHCAAAHPIDGLWHDLHHRKTHPVPGVRFYTHSTGSHYEANADNVADALVGQAMNTVDFPSLIRQAWDDGVRVFVEHGPRAGCTRWIGRILGDREHVAVSLDRTGRDSLAQAVDSTARLVAAGLPVDHNNLDERLGRARPLRKPEERDHKSAAGSLSFSAHLPPVRLPAPGAGAEAQIAAEEPPQDSQVMAPAPTLPPVSSPAPAALIVEAPTRRQQPARQPAPQPTRPSTRQPAVQAASPRAQVLDQSNDVRAQMTAMHQAFLREQAELHERFLRHRERGAQWLLETYVGGDERSYVAQANHSPASGSRREPSTGATGRDLDRPQADQSPASGSRREPSTGATGRVSEQPENTFARRALEIHAAGKISEIFGPEFEPQDGYARQVRMPKPPLLLADRVTGIDAPKAEMGPGTMWTETDVTADAWYLNDGHMPTGVMVESGQADLMLISWMGVDLQNKGERVYRLLGCELTFHGGLPEPGETLCFDIHIDGHAHQGPVHIFFFHYDCHVDGQRRLSMREGQAGFFTEKELAESAGVIWDPSDMEIPDDARLDEPAVACTRSQFDDQKLAAFADGRVLDCFGPGFERAAAHSEPPCIQSGPMRLIDEVEVFAPRGGPHERGYLRAVQHVSPDTWFFDGHFKNDPCMPGTLMLEGCIQAMSFYLTGLGYTLERDAWRFEPVPDEPVQMRCRGQVTPTSKKVVYEVFVREVVAGPQPRLIADLMCTVDGLKAFHCRRLGLRMVPDYPLDRHPEWLPDEASQRAAARVEGFRYDDASVLACAVGRPSEAFGPMYERFDGPQRAPRLPGPPYLVISRIARVDGPRGGLENGSKVAAEYDVPDDAWYFSDNGAPVMPYCVLLEAGLQPCGWLASYVGSTLTADNELFFRNLDGTGTVHAEVTPQTERLLTEATLRSISRSGGMIIVSFDVETFADGELAFSMDTVFGFFPKEALAKQAGLPVDDAQRELIDRPSDVAVDLTERPQELFNGSASLPADSLTMLDRITGFWPDAGEAGLGQIRAQKTVDPSDWYFKAHFFQDPVQPGSLGLEALLQLLQFDMLHRGAHEGVDNPRFEPVLLERPHTWKYRGQVFPENQEVVCDMEITERGTDEHGPYVVGRGSLWVDGTRIYATEELGMRVVSDPASPSRSSSSRSSSSRSSSSRSSLPLSSFSSLLLDPKVDTWLEDHCPTFTRPALPMTGIVDTLAGAAADATGESVTEIRDVSLENWLIVDGPTELRTEVEPVDGQPEWRQVALWAKLEDGEKRIARGQIKCGPAWPTTPEPVAPIEDARELADPYEDGAVFHGPAFQLLVSGQISDSAGAASGILDAAAGGVPIGELHPALLDAALHIIPHDNLSRWSDAIEADTVAYPHSVEHLTLHGPTPTDGQIRTEVRLEALEEGRERFPTFHIQFFDGDRLWADMCLVEMLYPKGRIARGEPAARRAFLRDREFVADLGLSRFDGDKTRLTLPELRKNDWFEGTIAAVYDVDGDLAAQTRQVLIKDHLAQSLEVHPSQIDVADDCTSATCAQRPGEGFAVRIEQDGPMGFVVTSENRKK